MPTYGAEEKVSLLLTQEEVHAIKNILQTYNDFISSANSIETIREELDEYKKVTDQRIEKLVNLFLYIK